MTDRAENLFGEVERAKYYGGKASFNCHVKPNEGQTNVWLTPRHVIQALGPFDLDPCASDPRPWDCASTNYTESDNGLSLEWRGFVWLNPPYGTHADRWLDALANHGNGIALIFARTDATWVQRALARSTGQLWHSGRLTFVRTDGSKPGANAGAPSLFLAYGPAAWDRLSGSALPGIRTRQERAA